MKISLITVVFNGADFLEECISSVCSQVDVDLEYIIVDGGSTDGTLDIIKNYNAHIHHFVTEKDNGLYDAINKGIKLATGDIIGILNADDSFESINVLAQVAKAFKNNINLDGLYGNLNYVHPQNKNIIRKWKSKEADYSDIEKGWMPAHPTLYLRRNVFTSFGNYTLDLGTAADYDFILRIFHTYKIKTAYLPILMVNMRTGGLSNNSLNSLFNALLNDYKALKRNKVSHPLSVLLQKKLSKLSQFF
ncbi:glycosyltransferase family 2 protein [Pedobacter mucosus]|uniref:glycosyltransferase family 2 protein n=1 Tax=Pedobacter mucosus TaxID=2895286 RepID=UPI001EE47D5E|nr:glycosyltransferase family 2 protein [Pedobacter mucosus]UKT64414.1 glycosyltransferase [Pedobacter mucosus]